MSRRVIGWGLLSLVLATGCVKKSTYEALQQKDAKQISDLEGQLAQEKQKVVSLEQALAEEQHKLKLQTLEVQRLNGELESAQKQLAELVKNSSSLKNSIQEMQDALAALNAQKAQTEARVAEFRKLLESFKSLIDAGKLKVKVVNGRMVVELPSDVLFASGSIDLSDAGKASIGEVGAIFVTMADREFQVEGHTDDQPIKTARFPSNWELAAGRAIAVAQILIKSGLQPNKVSAASFGEFRPVASNKDATGRAQNRRIEIVLVPDLSKVPGFEELQSVSK